MKFIVISILVGVSRASDIKLVTFDGEKSTMHEWKEKNDPVMGGRSTGTTTVSNGMLVFDGNVAIVPSLQAPGFITSQTDQTWFHNVAFPDVSSCEGVSFTVMSTIPYNGYRFCFGNAHASGGKFFAYGYKSRFDAPLDEFGTVRIPFKNFTDFWDDATGDPIKTCEGSPENCPDKKTLENMKTVAFWGEGVEGKVHLEVKEISAYGCSSKVSAAEDSIFDRAPSVVSVPLATFDGASDTSFSWKALNDPVMGGQSYSTFSVNKDTKTAVWKGEVKIVPSLKAPGFCKAQTEYGLLHKPHFNDASAFTHLQVTARSNLTYSGYKVAFAADTWNPTFNSYKANFNLTADGNWQTVSIPFSDFSNDWSAYTGDCFTTDPNGKQHTCCTESTLNVCPKVKNLKDISQITLWMEGHAGKFDLEVLSIGAGFADKGDKPIAPRWPARDDANEHPMVEALESLFV